jgi:hypothetical protein
LDAEERLKAATRLASQGEAKSDDGALKAEADAQKVRVVALKERVAAAEGAYRGLLETLSSGKWQVVPKHASSPAAAWGPQSPKRTPLRVATVEPSNPQTDRPSPRKQPLKFVDHALFVLFLRARRHPYREPFRLAWSFG